MRVRVPYATAYGTLTANRNKFQWLPVNSLNQDKNLLTTNFRSNCTPIVPIIIANKSLKICKSIFAIGSTFFMIATEKKFLARVYARCVKASVIWELCEISLVVFVHHWLNPIITFTGGITTTVKFQRNLLFHIYTFHIRIILDHTTLNLPMTGKLV